MHAVQLPPELFFGRRVQHLRLDLGNFWRPADEEDFRLLASFLVRERVVDDGVSAFGFRQVFLELFEGGLRAIRRGSLSAHTLRGAIVFMSVPDVRRSLTLGPASFSTLTMPVCSSILKMM